MTYQAKYYQNEKPPRAPRSQLWARCLLCFVVWLLLAAVGLLFWLWCNLADYENTLPQHLASETVAQLVVGDFALAMAADSFVLSPYESEEVRTRYLTDRFNNAAAPLHALPSDEVDGKPSFVLHTDHPVARLTLRKSGKLSSFGRELYEVDTLSGVYQPQPSYTVTAPEAIALLVNGVPLNEPDATTTTVKEFEGLPEGYAQPVVTNYTISGLLATPEVITAPDAQPCTRTVDDAGSRFRFDKEVTPEEWATVEKHALEFSQLHARFISKDAPLTDLRPHMLPDSPAYQNLRTLDVRWYIEHDGYEFDKLAVTQMSKYSDDLFSCEVSFDYIVLRGSKKYVYPTAYTLYYARLAPTAPYLVHRVVIR